jgi:hypothetical protein
MVKFIQQIQGVVTMLAIKVYKQKSIGNTIPVSIGCSQVTSGSISYFSYVF